MMFKLFAYSLLVLVSSSLIYSCGFGQKRESQLQLYFVSVVDFGAVGDGKVDDSQAFQKAVEFCEKNSKKSLFIPHGNYLLLNPITFKRGGLQILGVGALLREESWLESQGEEFNTNKPFEGSTIIIPRNSQGFIFSKTVADPVRIADIQFIAKSNRTVGHTTGISFNSEFEGPTWPFIIERCHFTGFNYAVKFSSKNQYNVAFLQLRQNAFNQNDECVYFDDINTATTVGQRNLSWGFSFEDNMCHDNSRVIRGAFAKGEVNIKRNNLEGNIAYSNGKNPSYIVDLEISNCTVNFEGNHFESVLSDMVYISSVFKDKNGNFLPHIGTTAYNSDNKVFIKGNNLDGVDKKKFKAFSLKGIVLYNFDQVQLYLDQVDVRLNESVEKNLFLTDDAKNLGTTLKVYSVLPKSLRLPERSNYFLLSGNNSKNVNRSEEMILSAQNQNVTNRNEERSLSIDRTDSYLIYATEINNIEGTQFLGVLTDFIIQYEIEGKFVNEERKVFGNYGYKMGKSTHISILPNNLPVEARNAKFFAKLTIDNSILGNKKFGLSNEYRLSTFKQNNQTTIIY